MQTAILILAIVNVILLLLIACWIRSLMKKLHVSGKKTGKPSHGEDGNGGDGPKP